jgi:hypothetical protein
MFSARPREIRRWRDVAKCSRLLGRYPPWAVTMVCRTLSVGGVSPIAMTASESSIASTRRCNSSGARDATEGGQFLTVVSDRSDG